MSSAGISTARRDSRYSRQAERQRLAALAVHGKHEELEAAILLYEDSDLDADARYALALSHALRQEQEEALDLLRRQLAKYPDHAAARGLLCRLLLDRASALANAQDSEGLGQTVTEVLRHSRPGDVHEPELAAYESVLPFAFLQAGRRDDAIRHWEEKLVAAPLDGLTLHHLAVASYWGATKAEEESPTAAAPRWRCAVNYWCALLNSSTFWNSWAAERGSAWGMTLAGKDLEELRSGFLERELVARFQSTADELRRGGDSRAVDVYEDLYTATLLESKSSEWWQEALRLLPPGKDLAPFMKIPAGVGFFTHFRRLADIQAIAGELVARQDGGTCAAHLRIYFSSNGLALAAVLLEARDKAEDALAVLDQLPDTDKESVEALYLRAMAIQRRAATLSSDGQLSTALYLWRRAGLAAKEAETKAVVEPVMQSLVSALRATILSQAATAVCEEAKKVHDEKLDEAIALLRASLDFDVSGDLVEMLCAYHCDRADKKTIAEDWAGAEEDAQAALRLKPDSTLAKQAMRLMLNNQGCAEKSDKRAVALFERALTYDPSHFRTRQNLASALRSAAIGIVNASSSYSMRSASVESIKLLERAFELIGENVEAGVLSRIQTVAYASPSRIEWMVQKLEPELLRKILCDLGYLYHVRDSRTY